MGCPSSHYSAWIREECWNMEASSDVVEFSSPYRNIYISIDCFCIAVQMQTEKRSISGSHESQTLEESFFQ